MNLRRFVQSIKGNLAEVILAISLYLVAIVFVIYPLVAVSAQTLTTSNGYSLANYIDYFSDPFYSECFFNSIILGLGVVLTTTILGVPVAYILSRYKIRFKRIFTAFSILPIVMPPFIGAYAFLRILGKNGALNLLLNDWGIISEPINFLYGIHGIIFIETIHLLPFITLSVSAAITNIDASLEEAAEIEGASGLRRFFTVTFPLARPSYMSGAFLVFVFTFADWLTPIVVGQTRFLSSNAYIDVAYGGAMDIHRRQMGLISCVLACLVSIVALLSTRKYVELKSYVALTKGTLAKGRIFEVARLKKALVYAFTTVIIILTLISPATITVGSFSKAWSLTVLPERWTLDSFMLSLAGTRQYISNSFFYCGIAIVIGLAISFSMAYILARTEVPGKNLLDGITTMLLALPGIVIGAGYMVGFGGEVSLFHFSLARMWLVMPIVIAMRRLPYLARSCHASFLQLDRSLEEASEIEGASRLRTFFNISLPLIMRGVFAGAIMMFVMSMQEISATIFLYQPGWETIPIGIYLKWLGGADFAYAASLSFVLIVIMGVLIFIASKLGARVFGGAFAA